MDDLDDQLVVSVSRAITRRRFLSKTMKASIALGAALSQYLYVTGKASAVTCAHNHGYGCYCNSATPTCSQYQSGWCVNGDSCPSAFYWRCDGWTTSPYCWCSDNCLIGSHNGYYNCCDCWYLGQRTDCTQGANPCICGKRYFTS
jgi:hypothetical protein